jgi:uncharacterized protein YciI
MFIILLRFSSRRTAAPQFMAAHKQWLKQGFDDGVFLLAGSLEPSQGGGILAHGVTLEKLQQRVNEDPFVAGQVVSAEIIELDPGMADPRLNFLLA